jgi:hypothetical protein
LELIFQIAFFWSNFLLLLQRDAFNALNFEAAKFFSFPSNSMQHITRPPQHITPIDAAFGLVGEGR